jgi:hypothetical protein
VIQCAGLQYSVSAWWCNSQVVAALKGLNRAIPCGNTVSSSTSKLLALPVREA